MIRLKHCLSAALVSVLVTRPVLAEPLRIPFDFSRSEIAVAATIRGAPVYVFLDTGVDPSTIDLARARALHLKIGQTAGDVSGTGGGKSPQAFSATIDGFAIAGRTFPAFDAAALDLGSIGAEYGRPVDAVIGFSFLHDKTVLIDYPARTLEILASAADAGAETRSCRTKWSADLRLIPGDNWPSFAAFRFGAASAPVTLDTGSNSWLMLYQGALGVPGLRALLVSQGTTQAGGFRGQETRRKYAFAAPLGFGPFALPPGTPVMLNTSAGPGGVVANAGNKLFAALKVKMLLDYKTRRLASFGNCSSHPER
jgi:hypothetical protein